MPSSGGPEAPRLSGKALFFQEPGRVLIIVEVTGLPENPSGFFALHIHEGDSCEGKDFSATKGHYNPKDLPHPLHGGDLPPLLKCGKGAWLAFRTDRFCVSQILGRTLVIHGGPDDFHTQPSGNPGAKIACGVIRSAKHCHQR